MQEKYLKFVLVKMRNSEKMALINVKLNDCSSKYKRRFWGYNGVIYLSIIVIVLKGAILFSY